MAEPWRTIAAFENRDPALIHRSLGQGDVYVMAAGWQPSQSQFALSTKFVPWLSQLVSQGIRKPPQPASYVIGEDVPEELADQPADELMPGIVEADLDGNTGVNVALNLAISESQTQVIDRDRLAQIGVAMADTTDSNEDISQEVERQMRNQEIENQQQHWRLWWLGAIALVALEMFWGGRHGSTTL